jgi:cysteine desulfuration protein SufE
MSLITDSRARDLIEEFSFFDDWEDRYGHVIALGRDLPPFPDNARNDDHRVEGCASQVWLLSDRNDAGHMIFLGDSDAFIVKGLVAILVRLCSDRSPQELLALDIEATLSALGLDGQLTAQRANGLRAMVERIRVEAQHLLREPS